MVCIEYLGRSAFLIKVSQGEILIDPCLSGNDAAVAPEDPDPDLILVTHGHDDHLGDAIGISKRSGAPILANFEVANYCTSMGAKAIDAHIGGDCRSRSARSSFSRRCTAHRWTTSRLLVCLVPSS